MHASASRLVLVLLLIGWKSGANLLRQSRSEVIAKPITFRHSYENRSISPVQTGNVWRPNKIKCLVSKTIAAKWPAKRFQTYLIAVQTSKMFYSAWSNVSLRSNRSFPSSLLSQHQNESKYETIRMKMCFACFSIVMQNKFISIWIVSHFDSFWNWRKGNSDPTRLNKASKRESVTTKHFPFCQAFRGKQ